jgi:hypothetical protein
MPTVATSWCNRVVSGSFREIVSLFEVSQKIQKLDRLLGVRKDFLAPSNRL